MSLSSKQLRSEAAPEPVCNTELQNCDGIPEMDDVDDVDVADESPDVSRLWTCMTRAKWTYYLNVKVEISIGRFQQTEARHGAMA